MMALPAFNLRSGSITRMSGSTVRHKDVRVYCPKFGRNIGKGRLFWFRGLSLYSRREGELLSQLGYLTARISGILYAIIANEKIV
jgi:hypothetical protein